MSYPEYVDIIDNLLSSIISETYSEAGTLLQLLIQYITIHMGLKSL